MSYYAQNPYHLDSLCRCADTCRCELDQLDKNGDCQCCDTCHCDTEPKDDE